MARLTSVGFELNSNTSGIEINNNASLTGISTTHVRSGIYSGESSPSGEAHRLRHLFVSPNTSGSFFHRIYLKVVSNPDDTEYIIRISTTAGVALVGIKMTTGGVLQLFNHEDDSQIGADSPALNDNVWYRIELAVDTTTLSSTSVEAKIDGVSFASGTANLASGQAMLVCGNDQTNSTHSIFFEDLASNDDSGSFQNSWPGEGSIVHLKPNATGDNSDWTGDNTDIDEVTPDDATTVIESTTLNHIEDVNLEATPASILSTDIINCVQVGVRYRADGAAEPSFVLRIKSNTGGTVEESGNITTTNTTWHTNSNVNPRNYQLTLYNLPGSTNDKWTKALLDTAQIGARISVDQINNIEISTMWLLVDYAPAKYQLITHTGSNTATTTDAIDTTGANLIVIGVGIDSGTIAAPTDNKGNTYTLFGTGTVVGGDNEVRLYYAFEPTVGTGHTFTQAGDYGVICVSAWAGAVSSPADQTAGSTQASGTTLAAGSVTPTENNELAIAMYLVGNSNSAHTIDDDFVISNAFNGTDGARYGGAMGYYIQGSAAALTPTLTWSGTAEAASRIGTFKFDDGGGGGGGAVLNLRTLLGVGV